MSKTANELVTEYFNKPPQERINTTIQDYVFNYQQAKIDESNAKIESVLDFINGDQLGDYAILGNFRTDIEEMLK